MMTTELLLRKPIEADIESMYIMLKNSLSLYLTVNNSSSKNLQLIVDRNIVEEYVKENVYLCLVAQINSEIAGWLAGSSKVDILSKQSCSLGDFYIDKIVVVSHYRRKDIVGFLLRGILKDQLKGIVVDMPLINIQAIKFYEKSVFVKALGLSEEFYKTWTRMSKPV